MDLSFLDTVKFDADGLVPCIAQDCETGEILMVAYMNRDSLAETATKRIAAYWSRSRNKFWRKGEESGNTQEVREIRLDCDRDCVLIRVKQNGGAACHTGMRSCFYTKVEADGKVVEDGVKVFDPATVYGKK